MAVSKLKKSKANKKVVLEEEKPLTLKEVKGICAGIESSPKNYNKLTKLLKCFKSSSKSIDEHNMVFLREFINEIYQVFFNFCTKRFLRVTESESENQKAVSKWIISKYNEFQMILFDIWRLEDNSESAATVKLDALETLLKFVRDESKYNGVEKGQPYFPESLYESIIWNLFTIGDAAKIGDDSTIDDYLLIEFQEMFFNKYWDLKYYFFHIMKDSIKKINTDNELEVKLIISKTITLLKLNELYENEDSILETELWATNVQENTIYAINYFNINFEKYMIKLISLPMSMDEYKGILNILHKRVMPFMNEAQRLLDFLSSIYLYGIENNETTLSILALNGLWELMKNYNLEYPDFYKNLYAVLSSDFLHIEETARFFRLLELFMGSTHLPAAIVASFIKRLGRLCLDAPPSGIISCVPFIYNLLKLHPTCSLLIHSKNANVDYVDPFDIQESDPAKTNAIGSSLWEISTLLNHYHPNVSSLVKIFTQVFNKNRYNMEDFFYWDYKKLIDQEASKNLKGEIGLEFEQWSSLLDVNDEPSFLPGWTY